MRVLICGDRNYTDAWRIRQVLLNPDVTTLIEGGASGADYLAKMIAEKLGITVEEYPAEWNRYGKAAGPIRNKRMLDEGRPDLVFAFHNDISKSKGTKNMIDQAQSRGIEVRLVTNKQNRG